MTKTISVLIARTYQNRNPKIMEIISCNAMVNKLNNLTLKI